MKKLFCLFVFVMILYGRGNGQGDTIQILPKNPTIYDSIKLITFKCGYDFTSYKIANDSIIFKVTTDSRIMAPCILTYDTVNIGKLNQGNWILQYYYIDKALSTADSIIYTEIRNFQVSELTIISTIAGDSNWKIYPNPANESLIIENLKSYASYNDIYTIIIDFQARFLQKKHLSDSYSRINISDLDNGCYLISIISNNKIFYKQIFKKQ